MPRSIQRAYRISVAFLLGTTIALASLFLPATPANADELSTFSQKLTSALHVESAELSEQISNVLADGVTSARKQVFADESRAGDFYFAQNASGRCTITSVAMMVRRAAFLDDVENWQSIDLASVTADGWTSAGVKNEFATAGYGISLIAIEGSPTSLRELLEQHPEGIAAYDPGVPHAVLLTDYDEETDTFYCADPANYYAGARIPLADSWNGTIRGGQSGAISGFSSAWVIG